MVSFETVAIMLAHFLLGCSLVCTVALCVMIVAGIWQIFDKIKGILISRGEK